MDFVGEYIQGWRLGSWGGHVRWEVDLDIVTVGHCDVISAS